VNGREKVDGSDETKKQQNPISHIARQSYGWNYNQLGDPER
jgi:hypothetical protein